MIERTNLNVNDAGPEAFPSGHTRCQQDFDAAAYEAVEHAGPGAIAVEAWNRFSAEGRKWSADMLTLALSIGTPYESAWILPELRPRLLAIQEEAVSGHKAQQARAERECAERARAEREREERDRIERALRAEAHRQTQLNLRKLRRFT